MSCSVTLSETLLPDKYPIEIENNTLTTVICTPARCKIGAAFFSNRLLAFLEKINTGSCKYSEKNYTRLSERRLEIMRLTRCKLQGSKSQLLS